MGKSRYRINTEETMKYSGVEILKAEACLVHIHMVVSILPKLIVL